MENEKKLFQKQKNIFRKIQRIKKKSIKFKIIKILIVSITLIFVFYLYLNLITFKRINITFCINVKEKLKNRLQPLKFENELEFFI